MSTEQAIIASVNENVNRLIELCNQLKVEKANLLAANTEMAKTIEEQQQEISELNHKNDLLKMAKSLAGEGENPTEAKLKINELVREIDKCISLLNK